MLKIALLFNSVILITFISGCETRTPDKNTPEGAFIRLARCIDGASTECLFREMDNETRWTVSSIHKILQQTRQTVEKSYPQDTSLRNSVYGKWLKESTAKSDVEMFDILCRSHSCLKRLARGFGAIKSLKVTGDTAVLTTVRGESYQLRKSKGQWGITLLEKEIDGEKIRLSDSLKQVKRNAAEYEQQRIATGK